MPYGVSTQDAVCDLCSAVGLVVMWCKNRKWAPRVCQRCIAEMGTMLTLASKEAV